MRYYLITTNIGNSPVFNVINSDNLAVGWTASIYHLKSAYIKTWRKNSFSVSSFQNIKNNPRFTVLLESDSPITQKYIKQQAPELLL